MNERSIVFDDGAHTTLSTWGTRGPVLLCVHGMTSSRLSWQRLADRFASDYRVTAYDQRGHGDSAAVTGPMTLARATRDLANVEAAIGEPVAAYVGHSWGGAVVVRAGARSAVPRVVAIDPMIEQASQAWYAEFLAELAETFEATGDARDARIAADYAEWDPVDVAGKIHAVRTMTVAPIAGLRDENSASDWDLRAEIAAYPKPLLLALADFDQSITSRATLGSVTAALPAGVEAIEFAGQGHNLHRTGFDDFASALARFLAGLG